MDIGEGDIVKDSGQGSASGIFSFLGNYGLAIVLSMVAIVVAIIVYTLVNKMRNKEDDEGPRNGGGASTSTKCKDVDGTFGLKGCVFSVTRCQATRQNGSVACDEMKYNSNYFHVEESVAEKLYDYIRGGEGDENRYFHIKGGTKTYKITQVYIRKGDDANFIWTGGRTDGLNEVINSYSMVRFLPTVADLSYGETIIMGPGATPFQEDLDSEGKTEYDGLIKIYDDIRLGANNYYDNNYVMINSADHLRAITPSSDLRQWFNRHSCVWLTHSNGVKTMHRVEGFPLNQENPSFVRKDPHRNQNVWDIQLYPPFYDYNRGDLEDKHGEKFSDKYKQEGKGVKSRNGFAPSGHIPITIDGARQYIEKAEQEEYVKDGEEPDDFVEYLCSVKNFGP